MTAAILGTALGLVVGGLCAWGFMWLRSYVLDLHADVSELKREQLEHAAKLEKQAETNRKVHSELEQHEGDVSKFSAHTGISRS